MGGVCKCVLDFIVHQMENSFDSVNEVTGRRGRVRGGAWGGAWRKVGGAWYDTGGRVRSRVLGGAWEYDAGMSGCGTEGGGGVWGDVGGAWCVT